jgi:hypothetical protein
MEPIRFSFTPTIDDYLRALRAYLKGQKSTWITISAMGLAFLFGLYMAFTPSGGVPRNPVLIATLLILPPVLLVIMYVVLPWNIARRAQRNERLVAPTTWEIKDDSLVIANKFNVSKVEAAMFGRITETATHYLLHYRGNQRFYQIVPKRAFESRAQEAAFRQWLRRYVVGMPG